MNTDPTSPSAILRAIHTPCRLRGSFGPAGAAVLAIVVAVRGGVLLMPTALEADPDGYRAIAGNLLEHGTFGHGEIPTAYRPPLYPLLLAPLLALGPLGRGAIGLLHLGLGLATVWLAWGLAARWGLGRRAALAAALLVACDPLLLSGSALVMTETLAALLAVVSLACLSGASERPTPWRLAATGACLALAILCRPTFLPWTLAAALVLPWLAACTGGRAPVRTGARALAWFVLPVALVLAPWAVRNQVQLGRPIVTTTHGGYTLLLGNNPYFYDSLRTAPWGAIWLADKLQEDLAALTPSRRTAADELVADRIAYRLAWQTIRDQPATFVYACAVRVGRLWSPLPHRVSPQEGGVMRWLRYAVALWYVVELPAALLGAIVLWRGSFREVLIHSIEAPLGRSFPARAAALGRFGAFWGLLLAASLSALHTLYWSDMRMRTPLMPAIALAAAAGMTRLAAMARARK